jgi:uncharacterized membrane protein
VPLITILFGIVLIPVGLVVFIQTAGERVHGTALIPVGLGVLLIVLGALSYKPKLRKHTMHLAALLALLGAGGCGWRAFLGLMNYRDGKEVSQPALIGTSATTVLCLLFLGLCINSFIQARRRRQAGQTGE